MVHNYEEIVRIWYNRLRPEFLRRLTAKYSSLTLYDAENLYQDAFIAVQKNIMEGRVRENTSWSSYIMTIGMNLASHEMRGVGITDSIDDGYADDEGEIFSPAAHKAEEKYQELLALEDTSSLHSDPEAQALLGEELAHTPEPCNRIIKLYYYSGYSMNEIAEDIGYKNSNTAKSKKNQCMKDLIRRVKSSFSRAGFLN